MNGPIASPKRVGFAQRMAMRLGVIGELFRFSIRSGRFWLVPMIVVFLLAGVLLGFVQVLEYVAPFVYTMF